MIRSCLINVWLLNELLLQCCMSHLHVLAKCMCSVHVHSWSSKFFLIKLFLISPCMEQFSSNFKHSSRGESGTYCQSCPISYLWFSYKSNPLCHRAQRCSQHNWWQEIVTQEWNVLCGSWGELPVPNISSLSGACCHEIVELN